MNSFRIIMSLRIVCALGFIGAGLNHFRHLDFYVRIVPPLFPAAVRLVQVSGVCEILGGLGLLPPRLRTSAGWGLLALLGAVFPANVYMALHPEAFADLGWPAWAFVARLPLQFVFAAWVWIVSRTPDRRALSRSPGRS